MSSASGCAIPTNRRRTRRSWSLQGRASLLEGLALHQAGAPPQEKESDRAEAIAQRQKIFADAAEKGDLVAGAHVTHPGIGRLSKEGSGYRRWPLRHVDDAVAR